VAQAEDNPYVNVDFFRPSVHPYDILDIQTSNMPKLYEYGGGLWMTYNYKPLSMKDTATDKNIYQMVKNQFITDLFGHYAAFNFLDIGLDLPLFLVSSGDSPASNVNLKKAGGFALGDLRLGFKGVFFKEKGLGLGLGEDITLPTATNRNFSGDEGLTSTTNLIADYSVSGFQAAINLGIRAKKDVSLGGYSTGSQFLIGLGASAPIICGMLEGIGTMETRTDLSSMFDSKFGDALDFMAGLRMHFGSIHLTAAMGSGALEGYGTPNFRGTASVSWSPPMEKECIPSGESDIDNDGIKDSADKCPNDPGPAASYGCPDSDYDGITNNEDKCPDMPGLIELSGCPDMDRDGVIDPKDDCPAAPGPAKFNGCPDTDQDGIPDNRDKCPDVFGQMQFEGCPPPTPAKVKLTARKIEILEQVHFETNKDVIRHESFDLLNDVAQVFKDNPQIKKVLIEGHTDNKGNPKKNLLLSQKRAESVKKFLVKAGVNPDRLECKGFGQEKPIEDNKTATGRAANRRVEFSIQEIQILE
jgi:outer membrane protein OmpA-like peptidoglycan-associated protein